SEEPAMPASVQYQNAERPTPTDPTTRSEASRLRTVTGNPFPRKCACGCGGQIPLDPELRYVVDFSGPKPFKTYLREHSPDFGSYRGRASARLVTAELPGFVRASELPRELPEAEPTAQLEIVTDPAHSEADASPTPEAGRPWAFGQLVFNAGQFESARSGFADYAKDGESPAQLRSRVNRIILEDLEQKVLALRALHEKLRDRLEGPSLGDRVARARSA
ncbi:MAG: hypothetical protein L3K07_09425, partial [Thermoplasmata archaeon]|nr:hypothetical protein [Thermoplasmata archaeon]